jgi:hypothetical protein
VIFIPPPPLRVHQEEENEEDLNSPGRKAEGIRGLMGEKGLVEEDWNDRHNWRKKIIQLINGRRKM